MTPRLTGAGAMLTPMMPFSQTYQLVVDADGQGDAQTIEFAASGADAALYVAERATSYAECVSMSADALDAGKGTEALERLRRAFRATP